MKIFHFLTFYTKLQRFSFNKIDGFVWVRGGEYRHLVLFDCGLFD